MNTLTRLGRGVPMLACVAMLGCGLSHPDQANEGPSFNPEIDGEGCELVKPEKPTLPGRLSLPWMDVRDIEGAPTVSARFSSYCAPKPTLSYRVADTVVFVSVDVPEGPLSRCVEPYQQTVELTGLAPGSYSVRWEAGGLPDVPVMVPPKAH